MTTDDEPELTLKDEEIIRRQARSFLEARLDAVEELNAIKVFHELRQRSHDFYSSASKAIFFDELVLRVQEGLVEHRNRYHKGASKPDCRIEIGMEIVLFHLRQEIGTLPVIAHQRYKSTANNRNAVFVSYSHKDKAVLADIQRHFKPLKRTIDLWDDERIKPGQKWKEEIRAAIKVTKVAILLVSTDFLGSDFIATEELPPLLEAAEKEGAVILSLIVKPCLFEEVPELNQYQALNPPDRPLSGMIEHEREELLVNMVRQTKAILDGQAGPTHG